MIYHYHRRYIFTYAFIYIIYSYAIAVFTFSAEHNDIHFFRQHDSFPLKAVHRCIKDATEHKRSRGCTGEDEKATKVKSDIQNLSSSTGTKWREITPTFQ